VPGTIAASRARAGRANRKALAALYADGFNTPFVSPTICRERNAAVDAECDRIGRDPAEILRSANVGFYLTADAAQENRARPALARLSDAQREGSVVGGVQQVVDRVGEYGRAGISGLNISLRPPVDTEALEAFIADVMPQFA
jgi:alkanesulfonate monooxygenase SsuD/methylene tetrahydromethanopterin reductase-like flavin-dependent oxidoreductase (luciferase family)